LKVIRLHNKEQNLVVKLQNKERDAQQEAFSLYAPKMLSVCRQYIKDFQNAEETMLNGFLKVFTKIDKFQSKGSFEGWIRKIMINESISFLRIKKRMVFIKDDRYFETPINPFTDENVTELQHLVDNLKDDLRVVFNLYVIEGYKHQDIADALNITENTSKLRYRKAKQQLQAQYTKLQNLSYGK